MTSERTLQSIIDSLGERGDKTALLALKKKDRHCWSFQKLAACARAFANGLVSQDFKRGDTVALFAENSPEWIATALGIIRAGMVAVPLDVQLVLNVGLIEHHVEVRHLAFVEAIKSKLLTVR